MSKHFIKNIEIKNFKCFKNFEAKGFARINLITGNNNTGKTALMEAMEFFLESENTEDMSASLRGMISRRQEGSRDVELDILHNDEVNMSIAINNDNVEIDFIESLNEKHKEVDRRFSSREAPFLKLLSVDGEAKILPIMYIIEGYNRLRRIRRQEAITNINFIPYGKIDESLTAIHYGSLVDNDIEYLLDDALMLFDKNIKRLKQSATKNGVKLKLSLHDRELPVLLSSLGEGAGKYIAIISAIVTSADGYLFIDEIDNGIHYSKLDGLWEVILKTSKDLNVQVFAATHSKECLESYARVAKKLAEEDREFEDIALIELGKSGEKIESIVFDYAGILHHIEQKLEVRGW